MAIYEYRCERDGSFEIARPIGTAPASITCPVCAGEADRVFSSPMVSFAHTGQAIDAGAVPIGRATSNEPSRSHRYS